MRAESGSQQTTSSPILRWLTACVNNYLTEWKQNTAFDWRAVAAIIIGSVILLPLTMRLPFLGHDWFVYFSVVDQLPPDHIAGGRNAYPPWLEISLTPFTQGSQALGLALLNAVTIMTVAVATAREARAYGRASVLSAALLGILTPIAPMLWWQGNIAGLVLLGFVGLPVTMPYFLLQPGLAVWAIIARRQWIIWAAAVGLLSLIIWGWWPPALLNTLGGRAAHPISLGWQAIGPVILIIGIMMIPFTNANPFRLMALGAFLTPYLMPVHLIVLLPTIGRVRGLSRIILWFTACLTALPSMFLSDWSKYLAMLFPLAVWWLLRPQLDKQEAAVES